MRDIQVTGSSLLAWMLRTVTASILMLTLVGCGGGAGSAAPLQGPADKPQMAIVAQPVSTTVSPGSSATLTVQASGNVMYQWQMRTATAWQDVPGATSATLTLSTLGSADNGRQYRVVLTDATTPELKLVSAVVTLTVQEAMLPPVITVEPADLQLQAGQSGNLVVTASGSNLVFEWQTSADGVQWTSVAQGNEASLTIRDAPVSLSGRLYRVSIRNQAGTVVSRVVTLAVRAIPQAPVFTAQPKDTSVQAGQTATFVATASGDPLPTVRWQSSRDGLIWSDILGVSGATLVWSNAGVADDGLYLHAVATNSAGSQASGMARLHVNPEAQAPSITRQPVEQSVLSPAGASFEVSVKGVPTPSVQWQISTDQGRTFSDIAGANAATHTLTATSTADDGKRFRAVLQNANGSATSLAAVLLVSEVPKILQQPSSYSGTGQAVFQVGASGWPTPSIQWQWRRPDGATFEDIPGATGSTYSVSATGNNGAGVRARASNRAGSSLSSEARIFVPTASRNYRWDWINRAPVGVDYYDITSTPADVLVAVGASGAISRSVDMGRSWQLVNYGGPSLLATGFASPDVGYAAGYEGRMLKTTDAGRSWSAVTGPAASQIQSIAFRNAQIGFAAGAGAFRTVDGGQTWQRMPLPGASGNLLFKIALQESNAVISSGDALYYSTDGGTTWAVAKYTDGGTAWNNVSKALAFLDATTVVRVDGSAIHRSVDGGATWSRTTVSRMLSDRALVALSPTRAMLVGNGGWVTNDGGLSWTESSVCAGTGSGTCARLGGLTRTRGGLLAGAGNAGQLFTSADLTKGWTDNSDPFKLGGRRLSGIATLGTVTVAVGDAPHQTPVLRSTDGGQHWVEVSQVPVPQFGDSRLETVVAADAQTFVGMGSSYLVRSKDGGVSWERWPMPCPSVHAAGLAAASADQLYVVCGSQGYRSTDGGQTWSALPLSLGAVASSLSDAAARGKGVLVIADKGVFSSRDGGSTWQWKDGIASTPLQRIYWLTDQEVLMFDGDGNMYHSSDGGQSWNVEGRTPYAPSSLAFDARGNGFAAVYHEIYHSSNWGRSWTKAFAAATQTWTGITIAADGTVLVTSAEGSVLRGCPD